MTHSPVSHDGTEEQRFECSVHRCPNGCMHVRVHNVTLTFTEPEFHRLAHLLAMASVRLAAGDPLSHVRPN